eukprot:scaffold11798_cov118-Skeletonema_menzelii.AAC.1
MEISHLNLNWAQPEPEQPAEEGVETKWQEEEVKSLSTKKFQCMNGADYYVNSSSQHSFQQHYQIKNSTHHDRRPTPTLALPTQFPSSSSLSANHHGDKNEDDEDDEEADNATGSERERASSSNLCVGSPSNAVHDGRSNNRLWTFLSFIFIALTLSTGGLAYKNWQLQKQILALKNELTSTQSAMSAALPSASKVKEQKKKGKAPKDECNRVSSTQPSTSSIPSSWPSSQPSDRCTPLPFEDGIYIKEDGEIVSRDITSLQCTKVGDWDPSNTAGKGIKIDDDAVSDTTDSTLVVGPNVLKKVVVRGQTFDANAVFSSSRKSGALLDPSSSTSFCRSTFKAKGDQPAIFVESSIVQSSGTLFIEDSTVIAGQIYGLLISAGTTKIIGTKTLIKGPGGRSAYRSAISQVGGNLEIHGGTFGDMNEVYTVERTGGNLYIFGGTFKKYLLNTGPSYRLRIHLQNLPFTNDWNNKLCDGTAFNPTNQVEGSANYLACPSDYQAPTFPECE